MSNTARRILIVDDAEADRLAMRSLLERRRGGGYAIHEVDQGRLAAEACERFQPDCVLLDYRLPDMDGLEVLGQLRRRFGALKFAVVLQTGMGQETLAVRALKSGAHDYVPKSELTEEMLERAIQNALDKLALERQSRAAEEALSARQDQMRQLLEGAPCALYTVDLLEGRSVYVSGFCERLTGYSAEEMDQMGAARFLALLHPEDRAAAQSHARALRLAGEDEILECQIRLRHKDGGWRRLLLRNRLVSRDARGCGTLAAGTATEVREPDSLREMKTRLEQLRESNEELERFAYIASHDLQEPLRAVISFGDLLARKMKEAPPESRQYLEFIRQGGARMQTLVQDLLTFSRVMQADEDQRERVDCAEVLAAVLDGMKPLIEESGARIEAGEMPVIQANPRQIAQLFENLLGNAIKFRGAAQPVIQVAAERAGGEWRFCVSDNGIGFDMIYAARIFEAFKRLHSRTQYPGSGIGLALCKKIVERHGGRIWAESEPGVGSKFWFLTKDVAGH